MTEPLALTIPQAATAAAVGRTTIYEALKSGDLRAVKRGRRTLVLLADLRAWLSPRRVRYYPSRGVAYESHLAPPPHLVGLRVAAQVVHVAGVIALEPVQELLEVICLGRWRDADQIKAESVGLLLETNFQGNHVRRHRCVHAKHAKKLRRWHYPQAAQKRQC